MQLSHHLHHDIPTPVFFLEIVPPGAAEQVPSCFVTVMHTVLFSYF